MKTYGTGCTSSEKDFEDNSTEEGSPRSVTDVWGSEDSEEWDSQLPWMGEYVGTLRQSFSVDDGEWDSQLPCMDDGEMDGRLTHELRVSQEARGEWDSQVPDDGEMDGRLTHELRVSQEAFESKIVGTDIYDIYDSLGNADVSQTCENGSIQSDFQEMFRKLSSKAAKSGTSLIATISEDEVTGILADSRTRTMTMKAEEVLACKQETMSDESSLKAVLRDMQDMQLQMKGWRRELDGIEVAYASLKIEREMLADANAIERETLADTDARLCHLAESIESL
jgi:hypothetical protein